MKLAIFTSNGIRHKFVANTLSKNVDETLVICESNQNDELDEINLKLAPTAPPIATQKMLIKIID